MNTDLLCGQRFKKMPQSRVNSMQGSNKGCLPMRGHTRGRDAPTVLPIDWTEGGGTHPECNPINGHTNEQRTKPYIEIACCLKMLGTSLTSVIVTFVKAPFAHAKMTQHFQTKIF